MSYWLLAVICAAALVLATWRLTWVWKHRMQPGEHVCLVLRLPRHGRRVWHFHRPPEDIVNCVRSRSGDAQGSRE